MLCLPDNIGEPAPQHIRNILSRYQVNMVAAARHIPFIGGKADACFFCHVPLCIYPVAFPAFPPLPFQGFGYLFYEKFPWDTFHITLCTPGFLPGFCSSLYSYCPYEFPHMVRTIISSCLVGGYPCFLVTVSAFATAGRPLPPVPP